MAHFRGDGMQTLGQALREKNLEKKVELIESALVLHFRELEHMFENLGVENFCRKGIEDLKKEE